MDNVFLVKVVDAGDQLGEELLGVSFLEVSIGENVVKELTTCELSASSLKTDGDAIAYLPQILARSQRISRC